MDVNWSEKVDSSACTLHDDMAQMLGSRSVCMAEFSFEDLHAIQTCKSWSLPFGEQTSDKLLEYGKIFAVNIPSVAAVTCGIYFKF